MGDVKNINKGMTYHVGGQQISKYQALLIYNQYCDKWGLTQEENIQTKTTKYIFNECMRIYKEYDIPVVH